MERSLIVIEPHADDAYLSLDAHIRMWGKEGASVIIVTVEDDSRRNTEAASYASSVGAEWAPYASHFLFSLKKNNQLILPLGIQHPYHKLVREEFDRIGAWYYMDQPYARIQKNSEEVTQLLSSLRCISYLQPGIRKCKGFEVFKSQAKFFHYNPMARLIGSPEMLFAGY